MIKEPNQTNDTAYRIMALDAVFNQTKGTVPPITGWWSWCTTYGGCLGCYDSIRVAVASAGQHYMNNHRYEIWKIYVGINPQEAFPPEKVYTHVPKA